MEESPVREEFERKGGALEIDADAGRSAHITPSRACSYS